MQHSNRMAQQTKSGKGKVKQGKRNKKKVVSDRWDKKEESGRIVLTEKVDKYIAPPIVAKNDVQKDFLRALQTHDCIVFNAPAGVGKTTCVMSEVSDWLKKGIYHKVILARPNVGMGKSLGSLPGDLREKYEVLLSPLLNVLKTRYGQGFYETGLNHGTIELLPLEYARGVSVSGVMIVDEIQGCTPEEVYTLITRMEDGGKLILLGDPTQSDIRGENAMEWLPNFVEGNPELKKHIKIINATSDDIVRGGLCKMMVKAKERSNM